MSVEKNKIISIDYIMRNSKGEVLEDTANSGRTNYLHGSSGILEYLQLQLEGLSVGDKKIVRLPKEIGQADDDYSFDITICQVRNAMKEELVLGYPVMVETAACPVDCDCYYPGGSNNL